MNLNRRCFDNIFNDGFLPPLPLVASIDNFVEDIIKNVKPTVNNTDGGLYVGIAGISYTLYKLLDYHFTIASLNFSEQKVKKLQDSMCSYMKVSLQNLSKQKESNVSFYLGNAGVYLTGFIIYSYMSNNYLKNEIVEQIKSYEIMAKECLNSYAKAIPIARHLSLNCGSDEMFVGRAGYLSGLYYLQKNFNIQLANNEEIKQIIIEMLHLGRNYINKPSNVPLMYAYYCTEYIGAAHGFSAILHQMLNYYNILQTIPNAVHDVKTTLDFLLKLQWHDGNFGPTISESGQMPSPNNELVHWCHGAPGVIYVFAKAYLTFHEEKYLRACELCGECIWRKGLLKKGPGLCHGIAGNAYAFLLLYRLMKDEPSKVKWLYRARQFANFIFTDEFKRGSRTPDNPYSLYEGTAGTVCFLLDLQAPDQASFPFLDVF